jgi:hypothetical protein
MGIVIKLGDILREKHKQSVFENRVLKRMFGLKSYEVIRFEENCVMLAFITCNHH